MQSILGQMICGEAPAPAQQRIVLHAAYGLAGAEFCRSGHCGPVAQEARGIASRHYSAATSRRSALSTTIGVSHSWRCGGAPQRLVTIATQSAV
jgi:hypothetical protein